MMQHLIAVLARDCPSWHDGFQGLVDRLDDLAERLEEPLQRPSTCGSWTPRPSSAAAPVRR